MDSGSQITLCGWASIDSPLLIPMLLVEAIALVALIVLFFRNLKALRKGVLNAAEREGLRLRLLVCKRIALAVALIIVFRGYEGVVLVLFLRASGTPLSAMDAQLAWQLYPIFFGMFIMAFGVIQYFVMDTIRQYKEARHIGNEHAQQTGPGDGVPAAHDP